MRIIHLKAKYKLKLILSTVAIYSTLLECVFPFLFYLMVRQLLMACNIYTSSKLLFNSFVLLDVYRITVLHQLYIYNCMSPMYK